jgi:membrane protein
MSALNRIYETSETRPLWARVALSLGIAVATIVALLAAILVTVAWSGPSGGWHVPVAILRWAFAVCLLMLAFGLLVRLAPATPRDSRWASIGAVLVVTGWIVQSLLFKWYVTSVASFKSATGSLVVFIFLTTYFAVAAIVLLVGIELDEQLRKNEDGSPGRLRAIARGLF